MPSLCANAAPASHLRPLGSAGDIRPPSLPLAVTWGWAWAGGGVARGCPSEGISWAAVVTSGACACAGAPADAGMPWAWAVGVVGVRCGA